MQVWQLLSRSRTWAKGTLPSPNSCQALTCDLLGRKRALYSRAARPRWGDCLCRHKASRRNADDMGERNKAFLLRVMSSCQTFNAGTGCLQRWVAASGSTSWSPPQRRAKSSDGTPLTRWRWLHKWSFARRRRKTARNYINTRDLHRTQVYIFF